MGKVKKPVEERRAISTRHARGSMSPVVYFENYRGVIALPPTTEDALRIKDEMGRRGFQIREAGTIAAVEDLQRRLKAQEVAVREGRLEREDHMFKQSRDARRARLLARRNSSQCPPYERDVIDAHLRHVDEKHEARVREQRQEEHYFEALEFDASSHHLQDAAHAVPDMKDEACAMCQKYRKIKGLTVCARCASEAVNHGALVRTGGA